MVAIELMFPQVYGGRIWVILGELAMLVTYFALTVAAARERPD
jgi:nitrate/nitrite transporter NarK